MSESKNSNTPLVSVTVCVRDGIEWVDNCLLSLVEQDWPNLEIIAVDDGSTDGSTEKLQAWDDPEGIHNRHPVKVYTQTAKGLSAGRALAVEKSQGLWVAITDIDVRAEPSWINELMRASQSIDEKEHIVAVTGRTVFSPGEQIISKLRTSEIAEKYRNRPRITSLANGPCSIFLRQSLLDIGGFGEDWYHAEDMEVSLRLIEAGGTIVYSPEAVVNHVAEDRIGTFLSKRTRDARAHVRIIRNYPKRQRTIGFDFIGSAWWILMLFPSIILAIIGMYLFLSRIVIGSEDFYFSNTEHLFTLFCFLPAIIHILNFPQTAIGSLLKLKKPIQSTKLLIILYLWSWSLWKGLAYGYLDALFGRNGHRR